MKTTIDISDALFAEVQELAREEKTTFRSLTETGLRLLISSKRKKKARKVLPPLVTFGGDGMAPEFADWSWEKIQEAAYEGRGA